MGLKQTTNVKGGRKYQHFSEVCILLCDGWGHDTVFTVCQTDTVQITATTATVAMVAGEKQHDCMCWGI